MERVRNYEDSPEDILELMEFMTKFHNYSFNNLMLIQEQWEGAFAVASYDKWKKLGYPVKDGEKGKILVWVRTPYKIIIKANGEEVQWWKATAKLKAEAKAGKHKIKQGNAYKTGFVYDISQTHAKPEDYPKIFPNRHYNFEEDYINYEHVLEGVDAIAKQLKYEVFWDEKGQLGSAKGACVYSTKKILMNPANTQSEVVSTSIHELAHAYLHEKSKLSRGTKELQAELVACLVSNYFGLNTLEKAVGYISSWTKGSTKEDKEGLDEVLKEVQNCVKNFIYIINKELDEDES